MLKQRIITALILAPIVIACVFFLPPAGFSVFLIGALTVGGWEWANLAHYDGWQRYLYALAIALLLVAVSFLIKDSASWALAILLIGWTLVGAGVVSGDRLSAESTLLVFELGADVVGPDHVSAGVCRADATQTNE